MLGALGALGKRTLICQSMLSYILESVHLDSVIVLQYIDDVSIIGNGKSGVRSAVSDLCRALQEAGAVISVKSILEPVPDSFPLMCKHSKCSEFNGVFNNDGKTSKKV